MKRITIVILALLFFYFNSNAQITKGNWLVGGNLSFSSGQYSSDLGSNTQTNIQAAGNAGYFFTDKLAIGAKPSIYFSDIKTNTGGSKQSSLTIGPFLRYYFFPPTSKANLFTEGSYSYGTSSVSNQNDHHFNSFSFMVGPVFFLNPSVGLEFSAGYTTTHSNDDAHSKIGLFQTVVGLQFHLEKE